MKLIEEKLYYHNGVYMGDILADVDGFYKFWPDRERYGGYWDEGVLLEIASFLKEKNASWIKEMDTYFEASRNS